MKHQKAAQLIREGECSPEDLNEIERKIKAKEGLSQEEYKLAFKVGILGYCGGHGYYVEEN